MKNILTLSLVFFLFPCYKSLSQNFKVQLPPGYNKILFEEKLPGTEGSPYLFDEWLHGTIILKNGTKIEGLKYRYCVYNKEMQYQLENVGYVLGTPDSIHEITLGDKIFIYCNFRKGDKFEKDFFEILVNGKVKFLVRYIIDIIPANYNAALDTGNKNAIITIKEQYFLQKDDKEPSFIDKKGKLIEQEFSDNKKEISDFIAKERISFKEKIDLISLVNYYNSINK